MASFPWEISALGATNGAFEVWRKSHLDQSEIIWASTGTENDSSLRLPTPLDYMVHKVSDILG